MARQTIQNANYSLYLNGSTGYMTSPVVPSPTGFCFAMWVKVATTVNNSRVMDYGDSGPSGGMNIAINTTVTPAWVIYNVSSIQASLAASNTIGKWVHIVGTYKVNEAKLYVNGALLSSDTSITMTAPTQTLTFGRRSAASTNFAQVFLSNIVLHNTTTPWTATQVQALYDSGTIPTGATAVYRLTEGSGSVANDTSGNGNNGTITNGTWSAEAPTKTRTVSGTRSLATGRSVATTRSAA